jgi:ADP-ribose pyrophosphatase
MLKQLRRLDSEILDKNPWWEYRKDRYSLPNDAEGEYYYIHTHGSAMIIPITDEGKIIMVRQFRYLSQRVSLEFIGGGIKPGKSIEDSAKEELQEEAGLIAGDFVNIGAFNPMNGATDETCNIFVAGSLNKTAMKPEITEQFEVVELTHSEIRKYIKEGIIWDGMTLASFAIFIHHKEDLIFTA